MGFRSLQHFQAQRSTRCELCLGSLRSVLRVWLPSRRLTPSAPLPSLFHLDSAPGIHPSELSPLERYPPRFRDRSTHMPFRPPVFPPPKRWAGPTGRGSWVLTLPRVPGDRTVCSRRPLAAPLGFSLPGYLSQRLAWDFAQAPPTHFTRKPALRPAPAASRSLNRRSPSLTPLHGRPRRKPRRPS
jgi:hypothetical protein